MRDGEMRACVTPTASKFEIGIVPLAKRRLVAKARSFIRLLFSYYYRQITLRSI